jgi:signal peptidase I
MALVVVMRVAAIVDVVRIRRTVDELPPWWKVALVLAAMWLVGNVEFAWARATRAEAFKIPAGSMVPSLQIGDHIYVDKREWKPTRGDVIVFTSPKEPDKDFIKRVLAIGGDTIRFDEDLPVLNGHPIARTELGDCRYWDRDEEGWHERGCVGFEETLDGHVYTTVKDLAGPPRSNRELRVPEGSVFVAGDNRDNSYDSRFLGPIPLELVKGRALFVWWSAGPEGVRWDRFNREIR